MSYAKVDFGLKSGFKKKVLIQKFVLVLNRDLQKWWLHQSFLYERDQPVSLRVLSLVEKLPTVNKKF